MRSRTNYSRGRKVPAWQIYGLLGVGIVVCFALGCLMMFGATLKEDPEFWRYTSPYPVWFRNIVLWFYYPALAVDTIILLGISFVILFREAKYWVLNVSLAGLMSVNWMLYAVTLWIIVRDNL